MVRERESIFNIDRFEVSSRKGVKMFDYFEDILCLRFFEKDSIYGLDNMIEEWVYNTIDRDFAKLFRYMQVS